MAFSLRKGLGISGSNSGVGVEKKYVSGFPKESLAWKSEFKGEKVVLRDQHNMDSSIHVHKPVFVPRGLRWWEKNCTSNMVEIKSANELVDSLLNAGDKLVVVDFYSPGCGGCKALHPKICQFGESNPDAIFLKVNYEEHKSMCYALGIHVLPFFRFYRGAQGRLSSFSCTNATIKKFRDALEKHGTDRCSLGPARGLEGSELLSLASNREIHFQYYPLKNMEEEMVAMGTSTRQ